MNQEEFLTKMFSLYATTFNRGNGQVWLDAYRQVLSPNIDYDKLYNDMLSDYAGASAPSPATLKKMAVYVKSNEPETIEETETLIIRKGKYDYEYGVKLADYQNDIEYFKKKGMQIIKLKFCKPSECMKCNYNHVCLTAAEKRA